MSKSDRQEAKDFGMIFDTVIGKCFPPVDQEYTLPVSGRWLLTAETAA